MDHSAQFSHLGRARTGGRRGNRVVPVCDDAGMRIIGTHETGPVGGRAATTVARFRRIPSPDLDRLRAAVDEVRASEDRSEQATGTDPRFVLERGFSAGGRAIARLIVGLGVVVVLLGAVVAFLAPSTTVPVSGFVVAPAIVAVLLTVVFAATHDTGLVIGRDGRLRVESWQGITDVDLTSFADVTVAGRGA
ncbi:MAG: hypothetical protein RIB98_17735 [Acidimicrobiales bacterium]